jgi:hypothetical protein
MSSYWSWLNSPTLSSPQQPQRCGTSVAGDPQRLTRLGAPPSIATGAVSRERYERLERLGAELGYGEFVVGNIDHLIEEPDDTDRKVGE